VDSKAECDQLNLARETKTNKRQYPLSSVHCAGSRSVKAVQKESEDFGEEDLRKRWVLSLEWKAKGATDGDSEGDNSD